MSVRLEFKRRRALDWRVFSGGPIRVNGAPRRPPVMRQLVSAMEQRLCSPHQPHAIYIASKGIDAYAGEGTYQLNMNRALSFYHPHLRQVFYESITDFDEVSRVLAVNAVLEEGGAPSWVQQDIALGFRVFRSMFTAPKGELSIPEANVDEVGDHCVAAVGIDSADRIMFRNSWGVAWGHNGYGFMPRGYYEKYAIETRLLRNARVGPHPGKSNRIRAADSPEEYAQAWMLENSRWRKRFRHGSKRLEWVVYETISVDGSLVEVLELRSAYGLRLAWAHVFHSKESDKPIVIVKEFFVWPAFRRRGFGRLLEWGVRDLAPKYGATCVRLLLHQCDYLDGRVVVGREFAACLGYNWCWATTPNQTLAAVAAKKL